MHPWHNYVHLVSSTLSMLIPYDVMQPASSGGRRKWGRMKCTATNDGNYGQVWRLPEKWDASSPYSIVYEHTDYSIWLSRWWIIKPYCVSHLITLIIKLYNHLLKH